MNICIIDAELADKRISSNRFPNLACMKLSAYHKEKGDNVELRTNYQEIERYDVVYISRVFTKTYVPSSVPEMENVKIGGTGFFFDKYDNAPMLIPEIEHHKPDYNLYDKWIKEQREDGAKDSDLKYYTDYSIGFTTRGCTRKCGFCVNRHSNLVLLASPLDEFFDENRKKICLLDDNIFAFRDWKKIFDELKEKTKKYKTTFEYKQGMDLRLLTDEKAKALSEAKYSGHYIFAFDNIKDKEIIAKKCALLRQYAPTHNCKFYTLCAFFSQDENDIRTVFERIKILWEYKCLAYIMKHEKYETAKEPYRSIYVQLGRWCNQPQFQWKLPFRQYCVKAGGIAETSLQEFERLHPDFKEYLDMAYPYGKSEFLENLEEMTMEEMDREVDGLIEERQVKMAKIIQQLGEFIATDTGLFKVKKLLRALPKGAMTKVDIPKTKFVTNIEKNKASEDPRPDMFESITEEEETKSPEPAKLVKDILNNLPETKPAKQPAPEITIIEKAEPVEEAKSLQVPADSKIITLENLGLDKNLLKTLSENEIDSLETLTMKTRKEIENIPYLRDKRVAEIYEALKKNGLTLKE